MAEMNLQTRVCACGCGKTWKALSTSLNIYAMRSHDPRPYLPWSEEKNRFKRVSRRAVRIDLELHYGEERLSGLISEE